ncbi:MAG: hypothetical protein V7637_2122 [Mycobacteriales bacterium]|jgi:hypothetical protein
MRSHTDRDIAEPVQINVQSSRGGPLRMAFAALAVVLVGLLVLIAAGKAFNFKLNPFGSTDRDRSGPVVLTAVRDLADYHAVSGTYQVLIDLQQDNKILPDILKGKRTLFLAIGSVDSIVDFGQVGENAVTVSPDRKTVTLTLPHATLARPVIDTKESRVLDRNLGVIDRFGNLFGNGTDPQTQQVYVVAEQKLRDAAGQSKLTGRAETNTRVTLERLLKALGFTNVTVNFADRPPNGN